MRRWTFALVLAGACTTPPAPGEFGTLRYVTRVQGEPPLRVIPPLSDLAGNVYTAFGATDFPAVSVTVSHHTGGESPPCTLTRGDEVGLHGWVGYASRTAWYWAGDLLVEVDGNTGACSPVLDVSPTSNSRLRFDAVLPFVYDAPSQTTVVAFVSAPGDPAPSIVRVALRQKTFASSRDFDPPHAREVVILGVGADLERQVGMVLLQWKEGEAVVTEGRVYNAEAGLESATRFELPPQEPNAIRGYLARSPEGIVGGVLADGKVILYSDSGARVLDAPLEAVGVHRWKDELFVVGTSDDQPALARIADGQIGGAIRWSASLAAARELAGLREVRDDRTPPARIVTWDNIRYASGPFPFVQPFSLTPHAPGVTLVPLAGPSFDGPAGKVTALAVAPVGVEYP